MTLAGATFATLPPAPGRVLDAEGRPRYGAYAGALEAIDWTGLFPARGRLYRLLHHKRWQYLAVATDEVLAAFAMVDVGYVANGFVYVVDLAARRLLVERSLLSPPRMGAEVGPRPAAGARARFRGPGVALDFERPLSDTTCRLTVRVGRRVRGTVELDAKGVTPLTVISPIPGDGTANCTQKLSGLPARGQLEIEGRRLSLDGGVGGLDYTNGLLARSTAWRWGFAFGRAPGGVPVGWNLTQGFGGSEAFGENAVWLGGALHPVGPAHFEFDPEQPLAAWRVTTRCGAVELEFAPAAAHREDHELLVARSHFVQPAGRFRGRLRLDGQTVDVADVPGVTEDQQVTW